MAPTQPGSLVHPGHGQDVEIPQMEPAQPVQAVRATSADGAVTTTTTRARSSNRRDRPRPPQPTLQHFRSVGADHETLRRWGLALRADIRRAQKLHRQLRMEALVLGRPCGILAVRFREWESRLRALQHEVVEFRRCCRAWRQMLSHALEASQERHEWEFASA